jgi:hypothetical protein
MNLGTWKIGTLETWHGRLARDPELVERAARDSDPTGETPVPLSCA